MKCLSALESRQERWLRRATSQTCLQSLHVYQTRASVSELDNPSDWTGPTALRITHSPSEELRRRKVCLLDENMAEDPD